MSDATLVPLPIDTDLVPILNTERARLQSGRIVSRILRAQTPHANTLMDAIGRLKTHAHMRGLTDALLEEELHAANAENRS